MADTNSRRRSISRRSKIVGGVTHLTPKGASSSSPEKPPDAFGSSGIEHDRESDPTRRFMRDNPVGTIKDDPEEITVGEGKTVEAGWIDDGPLPEGETPESIAEKQRAAASTEGEPEFEPTEEPSDEPQEPVEAKPAAAKPAATAQPARPAAAKPAEQPAAAKPAATPQEPKFDYNQRVQVTEDPRDTWTVWQIRQRLEEMPPLEQKAKGLDRVLGALNQPDVERAVGFIEPYIKSLRENPDRAAVIDEITAAPPAAVNYVRTLLQHFGTLTPEQRAEFGAIEQPRPAQPAAPQADKRVERLTKIAMQTRVSNEAAIVGRRYPFFRNNPEAAQELENMANALQAADIKAGIDPLDARGMLDVIEMNKAAYEAMLITYNMENQRSHGTPNGKPFAEPAPGQGREALLTSSEPEPPRTLPKPRSRIYRGGDPVTAFETDFPGR